MTNKILRKAAVALAVFVIILSGIAVFGLMVLGLSAIQAIMAQIGLPTWSLLAFVAILTVVCEVILELKQLFNKLCACKDGNTSLLFQMALLFSRLSLTNPNELRRKWFRKKEFSILIWKKEMQRIAKERRGLMSQVLYDIQASPTIDPETIPTEQRPKLRIGSSVYYVVRDNNWRVVEEKVAEVGVNGFFISNVKGGMEPDDYIPYADIGNEWVLSKKEAEQMAKTRKAEKMCCNCAYWDDIPFDGGCTCKQSEYYSKYPNETDSCNCFKERDEND